MSYETASPSLEERRALLRYAQHLCRSRADADDLVQEALLRMWRARPEFPSEGHRRAWLKRVVLNGHIDSRRRHKRARDWVSLSMHDSAVSHTAMPYGERVTASMHRHLDALSDDYRDVLLMVDVGEASYQEAAQELACPIGTVMSRLHRARRQLRDRITEERPRSIASAGTPSAAVVASSTMPAASTARRSVRRSNEERVARTPARQQSAIVASAA